MASRHTSLYSFGLSVHPDNPMEACHRDELPSCLWVLVLIDTGEVGEGLTCVQTDFNSSAQLLVTVHHSERVIQLYVITLPCQPVERARLCTVYHDVREAFLVDIVCDLVEVP